MGLGRDLVDALHRDCGLPATVLRRMRPATRAPSLPSSLFVCSQLTLHRDVWTYCILLSLTIGPVFTDRKDPINTAALRVADPLSETFDTKDEAEE